MKSVLVVSRLAAAVAVFCCLALTPSAQAQSVLYGGGSGNSANFGEFGTVNQTNADFTFRGDPTAAGPLVGLAFNSAGELFGVNVVPGGSGGNSVLIRINPITGQLLSTVGNILDSADNLPLRITDITFQPGTDVLFGIAGPADDPKEGNLYTINLTTAEATLVGNTGLERGGLAFLPNGTLYLATVGEDVAEVIAQINPATAAVIGTPQNLDMDGIDGLAARPSDSVIFGTGQDSDELFTIDPTDGAQTLLGDDDSESGLASLAFGPGSLTQTPAPALSGIGLIALSLTLLACGAILLRRRAPHDA